MFERYTEKARHIIFFARYEASQLGSRTIETEHLLLGLLHEAKTLFDSEQIQHMTDDLRAAGRIEGAAKGSTSIDLPLSLPAKKVLAYGAEEAERLKHRHIGPEHLLLGLMREPGVAATTLEKYGMRRDRIIQGIASETKSQDAVHELRGALAPLVERLTPEVEPAVVYTMRP
jgi:ATP-dependent Clp protease ATP-binding subunit ClpC